MKLKKTVGNGFDDSEKQKEMNERKRQVIQFLWLIEFALNSNTSVYMNGRFGLCAKHQITLHN